jgi:hypothetical protein
MMTQRKRSGRIPSSVKLGGSRRSPLGQIEPIRPERFAAARLKIETIGQGPLTG